MAVAAIAAVVHDVLITVGVYSVFRFEVTPATVIAFLTILGYSLYDTIVVFDKVKENEAQVRRPCACRTATIVNMSMNQVLMRSLNTSLVVDPAGAVAARRRRRHHGRRHPRGVRAGAAGRHDRRVSYSSIFVADPAAGGAASATRGPEDVAVRRLVGEALRGDGDRAPVARRRTSSPTPTAMHRSTATAGERALGRPCPLSPPISCSTHPPRPRKKKRR